ncbi:ArsO family NAD(P)H-dependent flavin-containing monooxygenase [Stenotrophomonas sp. SY1]|uniref:ArsO family NAD(P)H-dependent flavin-containing monooxygenase n=1 Tax=Stenotrophomonas sp. SY1 TaxID=477235 RepID=UPI001E64908A|nr:ArsO family NAD(P)H-dependent flavin-containing monooxygenase [Stenotrophomonas sp. SY1]MCD9085217.1 ArsO family NAD(P)H-dependent flavin-containing monooxygenase [Stenotrophomonas sp. SY1]
MQDVDVVVIGGGQAGLSAGYFLRRSGMSFEILDAEAESGGAWQHAWESLHLFSPASWSSIPGWPMPASKQTYPMRSEVLNYLREYERRYELPVVRPVRVTRIARSGEKLAVEASDGRVWLAKAVINATGTWSQPYLPFYEGVDKFDGLQVHSANYVNAQPYVGKRVAIVGGGNSGAQILAEVSTVADTTWITQREPEFLPDEVDGRVLFERATEKWRAQQEGREPNVPEGGFGDIVMIPSVRDARTRGVLGSIRPPTRFTEAGMQWDDGTVREFDAVIWCTGFRAALAHLSELGVVDDQGLIDVDESRVRSRLVPSIWLLGYGDWNGAASATLVGVTRYAREVVSQVSSYVAEASPA